MAGQLEELSDETWRALDRAGLTKAAAVIARYLEVTDAEGHRFSRAAEGRLRTRLFDWLASLEAA